MPDRRSLRCLMQLCCIFLLLFAQQAALMHAVSHARVHTAAGALEESRADPAYGSQAPDAAALCAFDAAYGQVLGAAPCTGHDWSSGSPADAAPAHVRYASPFQDFLAPLSRGPPAFLLS